MHKQGACTQGALVAIHDPVAVALAASDILLMRFSLTRALG
jgi:hypothetical protein